MTWVTVTPSMTTFRSDGGPLLINVDVSVNAAIPQTFSCRPIIDGRWAGEYGGYAYSEMWTEGAATAYAGAWMLWSKTRVYVGVPAGEHTLAIQCLKQALNERVLVGHAVIPSSLSALELTDAP